MDKYRIRRAILSAVEASEPGLSTLDDISTYPILRMSGSGPDAVFAEVRGLVDHGFLADRRPGRDPLLCLTAAGRDQLGQETDLDEFVWGEMASKFSRPGPA